MKLEELGWGRQDMVARAACAIVSAPKTDDPIIIGRAVAIALAEHGWPEGGGVERWQRYAAACQRNGLSTNRKWTDYQRIDQRLASRLAKEIRDLL